MRGTSRLVFSAVVLFACVTMASCAGRFPGLGPRVSGTFSRIPNDPAVFGPVGAYAAIRGVAVSGAGIIAVGGASPGYGDMAPVVWRSTNAVSWQRAWQGQPRDGVMDRVLILRNGTH